MSQGKKEEPEPVFGRKLYFQILDGYVPESGDAESVYLAFRGPVGSGRHTLVKYLAARLRQKGWEWGRKNGALLTKEDVEGLSRALAGRKFLLFLDGLEALTEKAALVDQLHDLGNNRKNLYVVTVLDSEARLPERLERRFLTLELELPEVEDRRDFIQGNLDAVLDPELQRYLCRQTEGWNYLELTALADHCQQLFRRNLLTGSNVEKTLRQLLKLCHRETPRPIVWEERFERVWKDLAEAIKTAPRGVVLSREDTLSVQEGGSGRRTRRPADTGLEAEGELFADTQGNGSASGQFDPKLMFSLPSPEEQAKRIEEKFREAAEATNT